MELPALHDAGSPQEEPSNPAANDNDSTQPSTAATSTSPMLPGIEHTAQAKIQQEPQEIDVKVVTSADVCLSLGLYHSYLEAGFRSRDPGSWFWLVIVLIPSSFLVILFGLIPLHDPASARFQDFARFTLIVCPVTMGVLVYFHMVAFLFSMQVDRPFRAHAMPVLLSMVVVALVSSLVWWLEDDTPPTLFGLTMYVLGVVFSHFGLYYEASHHVTPEHFPMVKRYHLAFLKVEVAISFFVVLLSCYVISWRYASSTVQRILPVCLALFTFIFRKTLLALTHPFPIEPAMLISGFWVENLEDMFQVMAYPSVTKWTSFFIIWVVPAVSNLLNLFFLTDPWFRFRIWVKEFLKRLFCCGSRGDCCDVNVVPDLTDLPDDRGHSNNHPGYRRRQVRFFIWKILSQLFSMAFYVSVSPILRFGANKGFYPFSGDEGEHAVDFESTLIFAAMNTVFVILAGIFGVLLIQKYWPETWGELVGLHTRLFVDHKFVGFVVAIVLHNGMISIIMLLQHSQIWYAFPPPDR